MERGNSFAIDHITYKSGGIGRALTAILILIAVLLLSSNKKNLVGKILLSFFSINGVIITTYFSLQE